MGRARRWPEEAEQERVDAIAYFQEIEKFALIVEEFARKDPRFIENLALKIRLAAKDGKHTLELARKD